MNAEDQFRTARTVEDSIESLFALHGPPRNRLHWVIMAILLCTGAALPLVKIDVSVKAPGLVRPATERVEIKSDLGGRVAAICVQDNAFVHAGDVIMRLNTRDIEARLERNAAARKERTEYASDLRKICLLPWRTADIAALRASAAISTEAARRDVQQILAQLDADRSAERKAETESSRMNMLYGKGVVTQQDSETARYEADSARRTTTLHIDQALARWEASLRDTTQLIEDSETEAKRLLEEQVHYTIYAPIDGVVIGFTGFSVGTFVVGGQALCTVSPSDSLVVESSVSSRDIGLLRAGQTVRLQVDAFPYTEWGMLDGAVAQISEDMASTGNAPVSFRVLVTLSATELENSHHVKAHLRKGMTVTAHFIAGRKSLLQLLYQGAADLMDPRTPDN